MLLRRHRMNYKPVAKHEGNIVNEVPEDVKAPGTFTKSAIMRMSTAELQSLAKEQGITNADELTGGELKKILIEKLGL